MYCVFYNFRSPLHLASCLGHHECVELLLKHGAHPNCWNIDKTITPLHCAASAASLQTIKLLVQAGAHVDAGMSTFGSGRTPLHYAVQSNSINCIRELLSLGASLNMPQVYIHPDVRLRVPAARECLYYILPLGERSRNNK